MFQSNSLLWPGEIVRVPSTSFHRLVFPRRVQNDQVKLFPICAGNKKSSKYLMQGIQHVLGETSIPNQGRRKTFQTPQNQLWDVKLPNLCETNSQECTTHRSAVHYCCRVVVRFTCPKAKILAQNGKCGPIIIFLIIIIYCGDFFPETIPW